MDVHNLLLSCVHSTRRCNLLLYHPDSYPDTPIIVDTNIDNGKACIAVKNFCDKIPEKTLATLFQKFVRLDDNMTRTTRGTGLGLFIVKGLVEAMEGTIELSSTEEYGFCATIKLNLAKEDLE